MRPASKSLHKLLRTLKNNTCSYSIKYTMHTLMPLLPGDQMLRCRDAYIDVHTFKCKNMNKRFCLQWI